MGKAIDIDWCPIQLDYKTGQLNCRELADKYKVSFDAISKRCYREGWAKDKESIVQKVSERTIERVVDKKMAMIEAHESKAHRVSEKLIDVVESSIENTGGQGLEASEVNGYAQALKTSVGVSRLSLGALDPVQRQDLTSGGMSLHSNALAILASCRKLQSEGKLGSSTDDIDVEGLLQEQAESKRLESEGQ